jgi:hypothetical protein
MKFRPSSKLTKLLATPRPVNTPLACQSGPSGEGLNDRGPSSRVARAAGASEPDGMDREPRPVVRGGPVRAHAAAPEPASGGNVTDSAFRTDGGAGAARCRPAGHDRGTRGRGPARPRQPAAPPAPHSAAAAPQSRADPLQAVRSRGRIPQSVPASVHSDWTQAVTRCLEDVIDAVSHATGPGRAA